MWHLHFLSGFAILNVSSQNSVYGCFPFFTPQKMKQSLTAQGLAADYTFDRPVPAPEPKVLNTFAGIKYVFNDPVRFPTVYDMAGWSSRSFAGEGCLNIFPCARARKRVRIYALL
jgi:hypothetical protein